MLEISQNLKEYLNKKGRSFKGKIECLSDVVYEGIMSISVDRSVCADTFSFGNVNISFCNIAIYDSSVAFAGKEITIYIKALNGTEEWIRLGTFTAEKPTISGKVTTFTAYDCIKHKTDITYFPSSEETDVNISDVFADICRQCGCPFKPLSSVVSVNPQLLSGYKCKDALGQVAGFLGGNIVTDNEGRITVRFFSQCDFEADEKIIGVPKISEETACFDGISCKTSEGTFVSGSETGNHISFSNRLMTKEQLDFIWKTVKDITYNAVSVEILVGTPVLEAGDIITLNVFDKTYKVPLMHYIIDFDGGIMNTCESFYKTPEEKTEHLSATDKIQEVQESVKNVRTEYGSNTEFINLINAALGLYFSKQTLSDGSTKIYCHNQPTLAESTYIFTMNADGFAFTTGENCWNNGSPFWEHGITKDGNAIINYLIAQKISADLIETGVLKSKDGVTCFDLDRGRIKSGDEEDSFWIESGIFSQEYEDFEFKVYFTCDHGRIIIEKNINLKTKQNT